MSRIFDIRYLYSPIILLVIFLNGCSTPSSKENQSAPRPLFTLSKAEVDSIIRKQWAPTNRNVFQASKFSDGEIRWVLGRYAADKAIADHTGRESRILGDCPTIKLLKIELVDSSKTDGSTNEIWHVDLCSRQVSLPIAINAEERKFIREKGDTLHNLDALLKRDL